MEYCCISEICKVIDRLKLTEASKAENFCLILTNEWKLVRKCILVSFQIRRKISISSNFDLKFKIYSNLMFHFISTFQNSIGLMTSGFSHSWKGCLLNWIVLNLAGFWHQMSNIGILHACSLENRWQDRSSFKMAVR